MRVEQLFGPCHDREPAEAKQAPAGPGDPAWSGQAPRPGCRRVAAAVVEGDPEPEGVGVLAGGEHEWACRGRGVLIGKDLGDLVEDLVILVDDLSVGGSVSLAGAGVVVGHGEGGLGLPLELDDDGADVLVSAHPDNNTALDDVQVRVELWSVV